MNRSANELRSNLESLIASYGSAVVGYSAGVDSSVVAAAARHALAGKALAVTAVTETITTDDLLLAAQVTEELGIAHQWLYYNELDIPNYAANPTNRCYFCKDALYVRLRQAADDVGYNAVLDGSNADDAGDYRPGRKAAQEQGVKSPLLELGITKAEVRQLAYSHVAHDCVVGSHCVLANQGTLAGHVQLGDWVILGGLAAVHQFCKIGEHAFVANNAAVTLDVPPFVMAVGQPAGAHSVNTEGLRRRGYTSEQIGNIRAAFKLLYRSGLRLAEAQARLAEIATGQPELRPLVEFLPQATRGIVR